MSRIVHAVASTVLLAAAVCYAVNDRALCPVNYYSPCYCFQYGDDLDIQCQSTTADRIQAAFQQTPFEEHRSLLIYVPSTLDFEFIANIIGDKKVSQIRIVCLTPPLVSPGAFDVDAFRSSENYTTEFRIEECDLTSFQLHFLSNFNSLLKLYIADSQFHTLESLPYLPGLNYIAVSNCPGFRTWYPPGQTPSMETISIGLIQAPDEQVIDRLLDTIVHYKDQLKVLYLLETGLTTIPAQVKQFSQLTALRITIDTIPIVRTGALHLASKLDFLSLLFTSIRTLEPGAFEGDFGSTFIDLYGNNLTRFDEMVFREVLEDMADSTGSISLSQLQKGNLIHCDCHLAWLIRDNRQLLAKVVDGFCSNGTRFEELDPDGLAVC